MNKPATYLGNNVYAEFREDGDLVLFTMDGIVRANEIVLGLAEIRLLQHFIASVEGEA